MRLAPVKKSGAVRPRKYSGFCKKRADFFYSSAIRPLFFFYDIFMDDIVDGVFKNRIGDISRSILKTLTANFHPVALDIVQGFIPLQFFFYINRLFNFSDKLLIKY